MCFTLLLLLSLFVLVNPVKGLPTTAFTTSATNDITVNAGGSGSTTTTLSWDSTSDCPLSMVGAGCFYFITETCSTAPGAITVTLPAGVSCSAQTTEKIGPASDVTFTLTLTTSPSTPPGNYPITLTGGYFTDLPSAPGGCVGDNCFYFLAASLTTGGGTPSFTLTVNSTVIPEYPLGLPFLAILAVIGYGVIRRRIPTART